MLRTFNPESKVQVLVGELLLTPKLNDMKKVISLVKRGVKQYLLLISSSAAFTPTGTIPMGV